MSQPDSRHLRSRPDESADSYRQFALAASLFLFWSVLIWAGDSTGYSPLPPGAATTLLTGMAATVFLLMLLARMNLEYEISARTVALAQCVFGIAWSTLYAFLCPDNAFLVPGMYVTSLLLVVDRAGRRMLGHLAVFTVASFSLVVALRALSGDDGISVAACLLQFALVAGLSFWIFAYGARLDGRHAVLEARNARLSSALERLSTGSLPEIFTGGESILAAMEREKGRTDRSNYPFSVCVFAIDQRDSLRDDPLPLQRITKRIAKKIRAALRAMDGADTTTGISGPGKHVVMLPQTRLNGAYICAERLRNAIDSEPPDDRLRITLSGGVAEYRRGEAVADLLARAEQALHDAALAGGNRVCGDVPNEQRLAKVLPLRGGAGVTSR